MEVRVSTFFSKSIRVKNKTFVLYLRRPDLLEVYGACVQFNIPLDNENNYFVFKYEENDIWERVKTAKKGEK